MYAQSVTEKCKMFFISKGDVEWINGIPTLDSFTLFETVSSWMAAETSVPSEHYNLWQVSIQIFSHCPE